MAADEEDALVGLMAEELRQKLEPMEVVFRPLTIFQLTGLVQLALRHPQISPELRATGEAFLKGVREYFADSPHVLDVIRCGDDPSEDR
jgi:hypothetical protein